MRIREHARTQKTMKLVSRSIFHFHSFPAFDFRKEDLLPDVERTHFFLPQMSKTKRHSTERRMRFSTLADVRRCIPCSLDARAVCAFASHCILCSLSLSHPSVACSRCNRAEK